VSEINRSLFEQHTKDVGKAFEEVFGKGTPTIDHETERKRFEAEKALEADLRRERLEEKIRAESKSRR
jgi:hypothetical protein